MEIVPFVSRGMSVESMKHQTCMSDWLHKVLGTWDRFPVLSIFSNAIDLSCILLEVEFVVFTALAGILYWTKWDANLID